jgi:hypothetical protein
MQPDAAVLATRLARTMSLGSEAVRCAFVLFPVVTMLLEAWLGGVPLTVRGVSGAAVVMAGVWFGTSHRAVTAAPVEAVGGH